MPASCIFDPRAVDNLKVALGYRVLVEAFAHYNGVDRLPEQIELKEIKLLD